MRKIEEILIKKMPRLACALYSYKHSKDPDYLKKALQTDSLILKCECLGEENADRNIYLIRIGDSSDGFFAEYNKLLKFLCYADRFGFVPVVEFTKDYLYSEDHKVNGTDNPYEYYFLQPGDISLSSALRSRNVFRAEYIHTRSRDITDKINGDYNISDDYIDMMGRMVSKYIKTNRIVSEKIERDVNRIGIGGRTIGVHYRGTDFKRELTDHPSYTSADEYIDAVSKLFEKGDYDKVFLATDDPDAIEKFKNAFQDRLCYYNDSCRSDGDVSVAFLENERKDHHYLLGLEVLRDMITLSGCGGFVGGVSQVSLAARISNAAGGTKYKDVVIISHGIKEKGADNKAYYDSVRRRR